MLTARIVVLVGLTLAPMTAFAQGARPQDCNALQLPAGNQQGVSALREACRTALSQGARLDAVERELNLGGHRADPPGRLQAVESWRAGPRLDTLEGVDAGGRLQHLEAGSSDVNRRLADVESGAGLTRKDVRRTWVLLAAVLVFFMQAGFKCLEVGTARTQHSGGVALLNLSNWLVLCLVYWLCGFAFMFGDWSSLSSAHLLTPDANAFSAFNHTLRFEFFLFQLAFAATAATIVDGALAERVTLPAYYVIALAVGALIYPVFGHWAWGGAIDGTQQGWLAAMGFKDFAGSTVVHSVGGWVAWVGARYLGPRRFRFGDNQQPMPSFNLGYSVLGVMMLWFGWWGFNGGSLSRFDDPDFFGKVASVIQNTNLAGASAGLTAYLFAVAQRDAVYEKMIGGTLGGLVAITASCDTVPPLGAILIGIAAGFIHNIGFDWLRKPSNRWRVDDVAGAVPVHLFCGILGTICAAYRTGNAFFPQLETQFIGVTAAAGWTVVAASAVFVLLDRVVGLRSTIDAEDRGDAAA